MLGKQTVGNDGGKAVITFRGDAPQAIKSPPGVSVGCHLVREVVGDDTVVLSTPGEVRLDCEIQAGNLDGRAPGNDGAAIFQGVPVDPKHFFGKVIHAIGSALRVATGDDYPSGNRADDKPVVSDLLFAHRLAVNRRQTCGANHDVKARAVINIPADGHSCPRHRLQVIGQIIGRRQYTTFFRALGNDDTTTSLARRHQHVLRI